MKKLIRLLVFAIAISMLVFAVGCNNADDTDGVTPDEAVGKMDTENEMTDDIYIEMTAHMMIMQHSGDLSGLEKLYNKHGVTPEQFTDYQEKLMEKPEEYGQIMEKVNERIEELAE